MSAHKRSEGAVAICRPRWMGWEPGKRMRDPCDGCPLYRPCVQQCPTVPGIEAHNAWIDGINEAAQQIDRSAG